MHQLRHILLRWGQAEIIVTQLAGPYLNIVKEAAGSLAISNVKRDGANLLSSLLSGSAVAKGGSGGEGCEAEVFVLTVLRYEMKNVNHGTEIAKDKKRRRVAGGCEGVS